MSDPELGGDYFQGMSHEQIVSRIERRSQLEPDIKSRDSGRAIVHLSNDEGEISAIL